MVTWFAPWLGEERSQHHCRPGKQLCHPHCKAALPVGNIRAPLEKLLSSVVPQFPPRGVLGWAE